MSKLVSVIVSVILMAQTSFAAALEALPTTAPSPKDNPTSLAKVELGKKLFFDPRLSKTGTISCNSCHNVMLGGDDNRPNSIGFKAQQGGRSAPTVWNAAFHSSQFWDGRAATLEDQAKGPITNPIEMAMSNHDLAIQRISDIPGYVSEFEKVWGKNSINIDNVAKSIAAYERTLITPNSKYDQFAKGKTDALNAQEKRGLAHVQTMGCVACHSGPNFSGPGFQKFPVNAGSIYDAKYKLTEDPGRSGVTKNDADKNMWRVQTLRNVAITAPYFHNGSVKTLDEAVRVMAKTQLNRELSKAETEDIVAFLNSLTGPFPKQTLPQLPFTLGKTIVEE